MTDEYTPATYTRTLDKMLARGARPGQGGHLEGIAVEVSPAMVRLQSSCWSCLAAEIASTLGMDAAKPLVREIVRRLGRYRGNEIRREVERRGLPLDMPHLVDYWDYDSGETAAILESTREPHYYAHEVPGCGMWDQLEQLCPQPLAIIMCEEVHVAVAQEFNPTMDVWYPALLSRGQERCIFRWEMPYEAAEEAAERARRTSEAARKAGKELEGERGPQEPDSARSYRALARLQVVFYHHSVDQLLRTVGEEQTEEIVRRAMRRWGAWRGEEMRLDHEKRGWPLNVETFITYFDEPAAGDAWVAENVSLNATAHRKDIIRSAYSEWFDRLGTGRFAVPMFEDALPAQVQAYNPEIRLSIPKLMERGDPLTVVTYAMGG